MKFVIAPDKFKDSLTGFEFCDAVEEGLTKVFPNAKILKTPLADGGDGTMEVVRHYIHGERVSVKVHDPLFRPIKASYLYSHETKIAYIEMAEASGLKLLKEEERNCMLTTTLGTGELIVDALQKGATEIILGIGGSATNDCGMGKATALGYRFLDKDNKELKPIGSNLSSVAHVNTSKVFEKVQHVSVKVACDVINPLYGKTGAAYVYAKQKGASEKDIPILDKGLRSFAEIIYKQFNRDVQEIKGAGAAGGMGAGCLVFLNAQLASGINIIKDLANFDIAIQDADWIITGEGKLDTQTLSGKTIEGVVNSATQQNIRVAALCGAVDISIAEQQALGLTYVNAITKGVTNLEDAMKSSYRNLVHASFNFANTLK